MDLADHPVISSPKPFQESKKTERSQNELIQNREKKPGPVKAKVCLILKKLFVSTVRKILKYYLYFVTSKTDHHSFIGRLNEMGSQQEVGMH